MARNWPNLVLSGTLFALSIAYLLHAFVGELAPINEIVLLIPKIRRHIELLSENAGTSMANLGRVLI